MDNLTKEQRKFNMSRIKGTNTALEKYFFTLLKENRISCSKYPKIYGKPDCRVKKDILVFVDSDFWHGWQFPRWKNRLPKKYWINKIARNIKRDKQKTMKLKRLGYRVVRVWEHELKRDPSKVISKITSYLTN